MVVQNNDVQSINVVLLDIQKRLEELEKEIETLKEEINE